MTLGSFPAWIVAAHLVLELAFMARVLLRPHRDPAARVAWLAVIATVPVLGMLLYLLFGETGIGRRYARRMHHVIATLPAPQGFGDQQTAPPEAYRHLFRVGQSITGLPACGGNAASFPDGADAVIDAMIDDIDAACDHVHLLFYIWLTDHNGRRMVAAIQRAAARGVRCRVLVDSVGSRGLIRSEYWAAMAAAGARTAVALPVGNPALHVLFGRIDLRNHRKIVVIDNHITYAGSQNCADAAFLVKARYAPWVDAVMRLEGPIALQNQYLFISDWMTYSEDDCMALLQAPLPEPRGDVIAQAVGTGPTGRYSAAPELIASLLHAARRELVITTPYYVPDDALQLALCAAGYRGVDVHIVFPARNDSRIVSAASRSYYSELLAAGVIIHEYVGGLLHAKTLTLDGEITLIGSTNLDRRSFDLNYENNVLLYSHEQTAAVRARQQRYIEQAELVTRAQIQATPLYRRLWRNALAMLGPVL